MVAGSDTLFWASITGSCEAGVFKLCPGAVVTGYDFSVFAYQLFPGLYNLGLLQHATPILLVLINDSNLKVTYNSTIIIPISKDTLSL